MHVSQHSQGEGGRPDCPDRASDYDRRRQALRIAYPEHCEVVVWGKPHHIRVRHFAGSEADGHGAGVLNDVIVRHKMTSGVPNKARA